jgi:flagellin
MALVINNNTSSLNAQRNIANTTLNNSRTLERLSSGLRINRARDDAAGLAISEKLRSQVRGLNQAVRNSNDGISLVQTAEGAISTATNIVQRLRELAVQSASDSNTSADRATLKREADLLIEEITRIGNTTEFNGKALLNGSFNSGKLHIGANYNQSISFTISDVRAAALGRRTTVVGNLADTASSGIGAALTAGELTINGARVVTNTGDDTVSVIEIVGAEASITSLTSGALTINSVVIGLQSATTGTASRVVALAAAINAASITDVTARVIGSSASGQLAITVRNGTDLSIAGSSTAIVASGTGIGTGFIGSTVNVVTANGQTSALAKAAAVNVVKSDSNVSAIAQATTVTGNVTGGIAAVSVTDESLRINGINMGAFTVTAGDGSGALIAAINAKTSDTGVVATVDSDSQLVLTAQDGRNIALVVSSTNATALGLTANGTLTRSNVQLNSVDAITLDGSNVTDLGASLAVTTYQPDLTNALNLLDISTQTGGDEGILALDAALEQMSSLRSELGALQNRLEATVSNLSTSAENLSAAESRIRDADFALETSLFTRNQILLQAGTAILAQANSLPQLALQLLQ